MRIISFLLGITAAVALVFFSSNLLKDNPAKASYWIPKVFTYQDQLLAKRDSRPKLVVIAGSNGITDLMGLISKNIPILTWSTWPFILVLIWIFIKTALRKTETR